jgi:Cof subfamily protein (haloacid dehalogenase superfamily)
MAACWDRPVTDRSASGSPAAAGARVELVATDLDGTVIQDGGAISARVAAALAAVEDAGIPVVFVTGRPPRWMHPVLQAAGSLRTSLAVCANGAVVYDLHTRDVIERFCLDPPAVVEAVLRVRAELPGATFAVEQVERFGHEPGYQTRAPADPVVVGSIEELLDEPVVKLLVRLDGGDSDAMLSAASAVLGGLVTVTHSNQRDCLLEISAPGVTKATTLARIAAGWGIPAEHVVAFGDQPNDLDMLVWAGFGYAMANAHPDVLDAVGLHAPSVSDDGVAVVIEKMVLDGRIRSADGRDAGAGSSVTQAPVRR